MSEDYSKMDYSELCRRERKGDKRAGDLAGIRFIEEAMEPYYKEHPEQRPRA